VKRIMVVGVSAGVGKSTFARKLSKILDIDVYHLDTFYWEPGWVEASIESFSSRQQEIIHQSQWIIEGNYKHTFDLREKFADTIIYLELPLSICLFRVMKRWILNIGKYRPDRADGCEEKLDFTFLKFICSTYFDRKKSMNKRLRDLESIKNVIQLRNKKEMYIFLRKLENSTK
jgi:adenylate kinase family enzyme